MKRIIITLTVLYACLSLMAVDLTKTTIVYHTDDAPLVKQMAQVLADDIERVSGSRPQVCDQKSGYSNIIICTVGHTKLHKELRGTWERYAIDTRGNNLYITGSDARGLAYGVLHVSETIGVSPWYWFADVPVNVSNKRVFDYTENYVSSSPTIKYRGVFINDEDWGLKTWAAHNYEKELGDIGPKTYDRICELILRLKGNMLAPAMHTCTGAFYSHPESQKIADKWGIMITTSHCEPLLFNNASPSEWDKAIDGEWNYETNSATILRKLDNRIRETAAFDNIYTMGMRGLHDEAMKGSTNPTDRARTLENVFAKQRAILEKYKNTKAEKLPQIFVPYKETLDIYDAGLHVPEDVTIVWPDDNYGYMKRVSNPSEQKRKGGSGVYYHLSYLGTPHDNLWIATTAPMLMYEELLKAYSERLKCSLTWPIIFSLSLTTMQMSSRQSGWLKSLERNIEQLSNSSLIIIIDWHGIVSLSSWVMNLSGAAKKMTACMTQIFHLRLAQLKSAFLIIRPSVILMILSNVRYLQNCAQPCSNCSDMPFTQPMR